MEQGASGVIDWHWTRMGTVPTSIDKEKDILAEGGSEGLRKKRRTHVLRAGASLRESEVTED